MTTRDHRAFRITVRSDGFEPAGRIAGGLEAARDRPGVVGGWSAALRP